MKRNLVGKLHKSYICIVILIIWFAMASQVQALEIIESQDTPGMKTGICGDKLTWTLADGILTIEGTGDMMDYSDGALSPWYGTAKEIHTILLPEGMTSIGDYAFFGCSNISSINIPATVVEVGAYSFGQCSSLIYVSWTEGVQILGAGAFQECESLMRITFPATLSQIGEKAFYRCYQIPEITIPATVTIIGDSAFSYCTSLVRATINAPLMELPKWIFYGCTRLTDVSLAPSIVAIGEYAFLFCENLKGVYTQGGNMDTLHKLSETISKGDGAQPKEIVNAYEMPDTSIVTTDDGQIYTQITASQKDSLVITVENINQYAQGDNKTSCVLSAALIKEAEWETVAAIMSELLSNTSDTVTVKIQLLGMTSVSGNYLKPFAGTPVDLQVTLSNGTIADIPMYNRKRSYFTEVFDFSSIAVKPEPGSTELPDNGIIYEEYDPEQAAGPGNTGENGSYLTDANGTEYVVTKRFSRWGITGKQFATYAAIVIGSVVMIVTIVMFSLNYMQQSKRMRKDLIERKKKSNK